MRAWFAGAFEHCLELCELAHQRDPASLVHRALLKARALLRLDRPQDALDVLRDAAGIPSEADEAATMRMLTGAAHVRSGEVSRGLDILIALLRESPRFHRTIRSEIALNIALAHYGRCEYDAAESVLEVVDPGADIVFARALEYRGWIAAARAQGERATQLFIGALGALDVCRHYDRFLEANCIRALAHLAVEQLDRATWLVVERRRAHVDWTANGLSAPRFWIAYCAASYAMDVEGDAAAAAREARHAEAIAPSTAYRVQARCKRASIARYAGERLSQQDHAESASELFREIEAAPLVGDEAMTPLVLAEELAGVEWTDRARDALAAHLRSTRTSRMLSVTHAPTTHAYQRLVEADVLKAGGELRAALRRYREAFETYARIGYKHRAVMTALRVVGAGSDRKLFAYADRETRHLPPQSWLRREIERAKARSIKLTAVQREVLVLICHGKSNPEIARLRKRSLHTIRNLVSRLFEVFEVSSREELAVECVRRGLYAPKDPQRAAARG